MGYERYEASIIIEHNETLTHTATMVKKDTGGGSSDDPNKTWRTLFYTSAALFVVSGNQLGLYVDSTLLDIQTPNNAAFIVPTKKSVTEADCDGFSGREDKQIFTNPEVMPL